MPDRITQAAPEPSTLPLPCNIAPARLAPQVITTDVIAEKYCKDNDTCATDIQRRIAHALATSRPPHDEERFFTAQAQGGVVLAGRIASACGTSHSDTATLINCFVQPLSDTHRRKDPHDPPGIFEAEDQARRTLAAGGGVGYNFSCLRPRSAWVRSTGSYAAGPMSIIKLFSANAAAIQHAGGRQAAQMALLAVDHPDILEFVKTKSESKVCENFNFSVAVTDDFMRALANDSLIPLVHPCPPANASAPTAITRNGQQLWIYETLRARDLWDEIMHQTYTHGEPGVFFVDRIQQANPLSYAERIDACNPCGEQLLPAYGPCCLASLNLTRYVRDPFTANVTLDSEALRADTATAVHMLDRVLDTTFWPLEEQRLEAEAKRRIGLGVLGLGSMLAMFRLPYDTRPARALATRIMRTVRDAAYQTSVDLAIAHGPFPYFDARAYCQAPFIKRLPQRLQHDIAQHGLRNSHLLSIAPTGTISLAFADAASGGIEPIYAYRGQRYKRRIDNPNEYTPYPFYDHAFRIWAQIHGHDPALVPDDDVPDYFRCALDISATDHAAMVAAIQSAVDSGISKTVNVEPDYSFDDFKSLYSDAYCDGIKSLATYRPNTVRTNILTRSEDSTETRTPTPLPAQPTHGQPSYDARAILVPHDKSVLKALRWPRRPHSFNGNRAYYYRFHHPKGPRITVFIGETDTREPFEIWLTGAEVPRGLNGLAINLSLDMYPGDGTWLKRKLSTVALSHHPEERFACPMPPTGDTVNAPSIAAALALHIEYRCEQLGLFEDIDRHHSPLLDALIQPDRKPATAPTTLAWFATVTNPRTDDDLQITLPEAHAPNHPDAPPRPYAVHFSGAYPPAFDALARALSLDMKIHDPAWIAFKLRKITDLDEPQGDFMAPVPGATRQAHYPSTVAYVATLILHRYHELGIVDAEGHPVDRLAAHRAALPPRASRRAASPETGRPCSACGRNAVTRIAGCDECTYCGAIGNCG